MAGIRLTAAVDRQLQPRPLPIGLQGAFRLADMMYPEEISGKSVVLIDCIYRNHR